jgi:hypothetical protein
MKRVLWSRRPPPTWAGRAPALASLGLGMSLAVSACPAASEGAWTAVVVQVAEQGAPPSALAASYEVTALVNRVTAGGASECAVSFLIEGLGDGGVEGGAGCTDDGFDGLVAGDNLDLVIPEVEAVHLVVEGTTMTLRVEGTSPDWERRFEGEASHVPPT